MGKLESGQAVLAAFLAKLPAELQATARETFGKPEAAAALETLGEQALSRADYSRAMDELRAKDTEAARWHQELTAWHAEVKPLAELGEAAKKAGWKPGDPSPTGAVDLPADLVRKADVEKMLRERDQQLAVYGPAMNALQMKHFQDFGEILDGQAVSEMIRDPRAEQIGILGVYQDRYKDQIAAKAAKAEETRINAKVEERLAEARKAGLNPRFPTAHPNAPASPLDALEPVKSGPGGVSGSEMADEYAQLVNQSLGSAPATT
jgi:hypothetical protein